MSKLKYGPYSSSRLECARCPFAFNKRYIEHEKEPIQWENLAFGIAVHNMLEDIIKRRVEGQPYEEIDTVVKRHCPDKLLHRYVELSKILTSQAHEFYLPEGVSKVERDLAIDNNGKPCDWNDPNCVFRGKIDVETIAGDSLMITDHKTSPHVLTKAEADDDFQLSCYAWLESKYHPEIKEFILRWNFCRFDPPYTRISSRTLQDLDLIKNTIKAKIEAIESTEDWEEARPGSFCAICGYVSICPVMKRVKERGITVIESAETAKAAAEEYSVLTEKVSTLRAALKSYVGQHDKIELAGKVYEFRKKQKWHYPAEELLRLLKKYEIDYEPEIDFKAAFMKSLYRTRNNDLIKDLEDIRIDSSSFDFSGYKLK